MQYIYIYFNCNVSLRMMKIVSFKCQMDCLFKEARLKQRRDNTELSSFKSNCLKLYSTFHDRKVNDLQHNKNKTRLGYLTPKVLN